MTGALPVLRALVRKDLLLELRGREVVPAMLVFVVAAFVLFRFGLGGASLRGGSRSLKPSESA